MYPVEFHRSFPDHKAQVPLCVYLAEAVMRASSKDQEVFGSLLLGVTGVISFRIEDIGIGVYFWVAGRWVHTGDNHGA